MTKFLFPFYKLPRVWRYFLTYVGKGLLFIGSIFGAMYATTTLLGVLGVAKEYHEIIWWTTYLAVAGIWLAWSAAESKVKVENIKILNTIEKGK